MIFLIEIFWRAQLITMFFCMGNLYDWLLPWKMEGEIIACNMLHFAISHVECEKDKRLLLISNIWNICFFFQQKPLRINLEAQRNFPVPSLIVPNHLPFSLLVVLHSNLVVVDNNFVVILSQKDKERWITDLACIFLTAFLNTPTWILYTLMALKIEHLKIFSQRSYNP